MGRISQHVVEHHESRRSSATSFAMEMCPTILWKRTNSENKSIHLVIEWPRVISNCDAHIMSAGSLDDVALCICPLDCHMLRWCKISACLLDGFPRMNSDFTPGFERLHTCGFVCFDRCLTAINVRPVVCGKPANRETVDEYVRFLPQIENCDGPRVRASRSLRLSAVNSPLPEARRMARPFVAGNCSRFVDFS